MTFRGKRPIKKASASKPSTDALKITFCGRDNAPLTMTEMAEALLELGAAA